MAPDELWHPSRFVALPANHPGGLNLAIGAVHLPRIHMMACHDHMVFQALQAASWPRRHAAA